MTIKTYRLSSFRTSLNLYLDVLPSAETNETIFKLESRFMTASNNGLK